jgi:hypothetical protein
MPDVQRCISAPALPSLSLPAGFSFATPGISVAFNPKFCCNIPSFNVGLPPIPINALIFAPLAKALKTIMALINSFIASIAIPCPRL